MANSIISEGKTTAEAIENGLKQLKVTKDKVDIHIMEEPKKSFFSILAPRIVKVELVLKEETTKNVQEQKTEKEYNKDKKEIEQGKEEVKEFLKVIVPKIGELEYTIRIEEFTIFINMMGKNAGKLIGYRGETLNAMQLIVSAIVNKKASKKIKVVLDIEGYRKKREESLIGLAHRVAKTVAKTGKSVTLEPMSPYERKMIHSTLQEDKYVTTHSIGENENRRIVIEKIK